MSTTGGESPMEAPAEDREWQNTPVVEDTPDEVVPEERPADWEANEADVQEQTLSVNPDEDDEYPHGAAEDYEE